MQYRAEQLEAIPAKVSKLKARFQSVNIATRDRDGQPLASYAPFIENEHGYLMLLSTVSKHARNLQQVPSASLAFIEPEDEARHLFARERLILECKVSCFSKQSEQGKAFQQLMKARFGDIIDRLSQMQDFSYYLFTPQSANYVKGFGQAFVLDGKLTEARHLTEGHQEEKQESKVA